jgi:hypothetical protein
MAERNNDDTGQRDRPQGKKGAPAIRWDETNARTISPTICTISATPEEFVFLFGKEEPLARHGQRRTIRDAERIIVNPVIAKRLAASLDELVRQYELRFGPLELASEHRPKQRSMADFPVFLAPVSADVPDKRRLLLDLVAGLGVETALEHSFKVSKGQLSENRFLLGINRVGREDPLDEKVKQVCRELDMPPAFFKAFTNRLPDANYYYFGFEEDGSRSLYKAYLEFRDRAEEKISKAAAAPGPLLLHLGFKWDTSDRNRKALTRYEWHHSIEFRDMLGRLPAMLPRRPGHDPLAVAEAIIGLASERVEPRNVQYLETAEKGNPRKSFDINLYKSGVRMEEIKPFLMRLAEYYDLDHQEFAIFCDQIASKRFGHLAGGTDREGRDFVTVYYGVEHLQAAGG